ncbi:hypothetical protein [Methylobacterium sp. J-076]|uniref:hypothetical protein n=1 Tax=Methylobacterium sp. J-076 TaxID=2836655 RepID=UPI001FBAC007|nr:hypothetical protein [Methylobacterium sp. J-076]MCJ2012731.1 hypothetical protein [Methylobacterium sp. J-076]
MQFDITQDEWRSFAMGFHRFALIEGPMRFVRFSHSGRGRKGKLGRFWMHASDVAALLAQPGTGRHLIDRISDGWAICDDWGDKALMWVMTVPAGARIPVAVGKAHFQPKISEKTRVRQEDSQSWSSWNSDVYWRPSTQSYAGGGLQYIIPVRTTDGEENKGLVALIGPKLETWTVASNPRLFLSPWEAAAGVRRT